MWILFIALMHPNGGITTQRIKVPTEIRCELLAADIHEVLKGQPIYTVCENGDL